MQNDFCSRDGWYAHSGFDVSHVERIVPRLQVFVDAAHAVGVYVVFVRTTHDDLTDSSVWRGRHAGNREGNRGTPCQTGTWGADFYGVRPTCVDGVVTKHRFSAFYGTNMKGFLRERHIASLMFAGVTTEVCVDSTLRDGLFEDYHVTLVEDCCASYLPVYHALTLDNVRRNFGTVLQSRSVAKYWEGLRDACF